MDIRRLTLFAAWAVALSALTGAAGCSRARQAAVPEGRERTWPSMGTFASVRVPAKEADRLPDWADAVAATFEETEQTFSLYRPDSEVSRINRASGREAVAISAITRQLLILAADYAERTGGAFDPTVAPLVRLWGFSGGPRPERRPDDGAIAAARALTGWRHLILRSEESSAFLDREGMALDLGGIAKGFAVDRAWERLAALGASNVLVNLGGNLRVRGAPAPGSPWRIGVRHPLERDRIVGILRLTHGLAVATSGHYERFVDIEGVRYTHIVDPRTGWPARGLAGVTVIAPTAADADALSTALFVLGIEDGMNFLQRSPRVHALFIPDALPLRIVLSPGCRRFFEPLPDFADAVREAPDIRK